MKPKLFLALGLLLACISCKQQNPDDSLLEFDVTASYPEKTMDIRDVADVEYMVLKSDTLYTMFLYLTDKYILTINGPERSFQVFDRTGHCVTEIARYGNGPEDYMPGGKWFIDDAKDEVYILSFPSKFQIYDAHRGDFKRTLKVFEDGKYDGLNFPFDGVSQWGEYMLFYDKSSSEYPYLLISRENGEQRRIPMHLEKLIKTMGEKPYKDDMVAVLPSNHTYFTQSGENLYLTSPSTDTVYVCTPDLHYTPYLVRKPSVLDMETPILLSGFIDTKDYAFFSTEKMEFDFETFEDNEKKSYVLDRKSGKFFELSVENADYEGQEILLSPAGVLYEGMGSLRSANPRVGVITLDSEELLEADKAGKVKGKLKEALDELTDEPFVLMIMKMKP